MTMKNFNLQEAIDFISRSSPETKIYIGGDSCRYRKHNVWYAEYTICAVVHINGKNGCRVFGYNVSERDYDQKKNKPRMRLMNEVIKVAEFYQLLHDAIGDRHCEIHLDINPNEKHGSSCVIQEAVGYIKASCNMTPKVKPFAPAASFCADRLVEVLKMAKEAKQKAAA